MNRTQLWMALEGKGHRSLVVLLKLWVTEGHTSCVAERRVQPRRAKSDRKQTRRPPGVGCHDSLGHGVMAGLLLSMKPGRQRREEHNDKTSTVDPILVGKEMCKGQRHEGEQRDEAEDEPKAHPKAIVQVDQEWQNKYSHQPAWRTKQ
jgi:hypothetical protein